MIDNINKTAENILNRNTRNGSTGRYTVPTDRLYPFQWNWDSCLCALGLATYDEKRAWEEITTLFKHQWENGMVPHIVFHQQSDSYFPGPDVWAARHHAPSDIPTSGISQPPVAATLIRKLYDYVVDRSYAEDQIKDLISCQLLIQLPRLHTPVSILESPKAL